MYKIIVRGRAHTDNPTSKLDGISCEDCFLDYSSLSFRDVLSHGYMYFEWDNDSGDLWTITEYHASRELNEAELDDLRRETVGQWSDGIGEGFEQYPCARIDGEYIYISPWHYHQVVFVEQTYVEGR